MERERLADVAKRAVLAHGGRRLVKDPGSAGWEQAAGIIVAVWLVVANGWFAADMLDLPIGWAWIAAAAAVLLATGALGAVSGGIAAIALVAAFTVTAVVQLVFHDGTALLWTHGVPGLVTATVYAVARGRSLARSAPLLLPLTIVVLFLPLFTSDLWLAANDLGWEEYGGVVALVIVPLTGAVYWRLRSGVPQTFDAVVDSVAASPDAEMKALDLLRKAAGDERQALAEPENETQLRGELTAALDDGRVRSTASRIKASLVPHLAHTLVFQLLSTVVGVATLVAVYVYLLGWAVVTASTAGGWLGVPIRMQEVAPLGTLPLGPYVKVSVLFAIVATAIFLAFALTEDEYSKALSDALVASPLERLLLVLAPFVSLGGVIVEVGAPPEPVLESG
jgi:hypothetical protein